MINLNNKLNEFIIIEIFDPKNTVISIGVHAIGIKNTDTSVNTLAIINDNKFNNNIKNTNLVLFNILLFSFFIYIYCNINTNKT